MIIFSVPLKSIPFERPEQGARRRFNSARYSEFKAALGLFAKIAMRGREPLSGAIRLTAEFYKPRPKKSKYHCGNFAVVPSFGDVDNHLKAALDSLNGICYIDDRQVVEVIGRKFFGKSHIEIIVEELN